MPSPPVIRVILCTKNEVDLIEPFLQYYGYLFGFDNITVVDNGSTNQHVLEVYEKYKPRGVEVIDEPTPFERVHDFMSKHVANACKKCDWLLTLETDEFLFWIPSMADADSVLDPAIIHEYLATIPDDISVLRYKHVMQSCVKTTDEHYVDQHYADPVAQMKHFANQVFYKNIVRARDFNKVTMWSHEVDMKAGRLAICPVLGLLHFHNTGEAMLQMRTQQLVTGYGYNYPMDSVEAKIAFCAWLIENIPAMAGGHRVEYFQRFLRRSYVLHFFGSLVGRLPSLSEMNKLTGHGDDLRAILVDIMSIAKGRIKEIPPGDADRMVSFELIPHPLPSDYDPSINVNALLFHEQSMDHDFIIMQGMNTLALARARDTETTEAPTAHESPKEAPEASFHDIIDKYSYREGVRSGTDKMSMHSYFDTYDRLMTRLRSRTNVKILENGIQTGAFLRALSEYLPEAELYGVDITLKELTYCNAHDYPRIHLYEMDGTLASTAEYIGEKYDVIIEDASHLPEHQVASLDAFAGYMKDDGVYIIEDINGAHAERLQRELSAVAVKHGLTMKWKDMRDRTGLFDDIMAVFQRKKTKSHKSKKSNKSHKKRSTPSSHDAVTLEKYKNANVHLLKRT